MMVNVDVPRRHVFGILTMPDETRQFRGNRKNFIDIIRTGQEMGVEVYVITVPDLVLSQPYVAAYRYDAGGKTWSRLQIPKPKVIYNRIPYREDEWLPEVRKTIRACMRHPEIKLFNPFFFNKWTLFEWLRRSRYTRNTSRPPANSAAN